MSPEAADDWFTACADPGSSRGRATRTGSAVAALLDCIHQRHGIHASHDDPPLRPVAGRAVVMCQTSGSGGRSKTILRSQRSWIASFRVNRQVFGLGPADRYAVLGAPGHSLALYGAVEALHLGAALAVLAGDSPRSQLDQLQGCTVLYATPTQLLRLQMVGQGRVLPALRHVFCGGGRLDAACRQGMARLCPNAVLREFYGASETSFATLADETTPPGSVGRAYPGVRLRIGTGGQIWIASPYLAMSYAEPDAPPFCRDGDFITVGDIGHLDGDGNLFLQGRQNRMVTVADRNLFLEDVESVLIGAGAGPSAVIALPDPLRGHAIIAVVEGPGSDDHARALRRACRAALGDHAAPRRIHFLERMPLLPSGKPDLARLTRQFAP
ncbi:AMP-binding protein [Paracoccus sp. DMF-8]|uniref:AMP-binding protein n=1 Tax=Paracoccus sp. DMF-8 TaxID=3019445 RepID=UPI0023E7E812|nr:AMP-binding protein [Paracoccus sp. DMF-8]MDF3604706.1 AMP-binding protein [Paracoccus sp. DMF-8]